jgi:hypothetical protein
MCVYVRDVFLELLLGAIPHARRAPFPLRIPSQGVA